MPTSGSSFPVIHSVLAPDALLAELGRHYAIGTPQSCVLLRSWINEVYRVATAQGTYILKVFRLGWRSPDELAYEVALMQHLAQAGIAVQPPLATRSGATVHRLPAPEGSRPMVLYRMLDGQALLPPSADGYRRVGAALAQMHHALDSFVTDAPRPALDVHYLAHAPLTWLRPFFSTSPEEWQFLVRLVDAVRVRLARLTQTGTLSWGPIHGDATLVNILLTTDQRVGLYDFDQSGPGWRAYELQGVYAWAWECQQPVFWTALLDGYTTILPLSEGDIAAMPSFPILNKIWCMGFEAHVIARNHGQWIVGGEYFQDRLAWLRRWVAAHPELQAALQ